jgi:hypothetical protein
MSHMFSPVTLMVALAIAVVLAAAMAPATEHAMFGHAATEQPRSV